MTKGTSFVAVVAGICEQDPRYAREAYFFVRQALDFTVGTLDKPRTGPARHVSGQQLLEGIRRFALQEFGAMTSTVFRQWGIGRTEDFGEIVFNLVDSGLLGRNEEDSSDDFTNGYDFFKAFEAPYLPRSRRESTAATGV